MTGLMVPTSQTALIDKSHRTAAISKVNASVRWVMVVAFAGLLILSSGCSRELSTAEKFQQMAEARAKRSKIEKAEKAKEEEAAKSAADSEKAKPAKPQKSAKDQPASSQPKNASPAEMASDAAGKDTGAKDTGAKDGEASPDSGDTDSEDTDSEDTDSGDAKFSARIVAAKPVSRRTRERSPEDEERALRRLESTNHDYQFSTNGRLIAGVGHADVISIYNVQQRQLQELVYLDKIKPTAIAFSADESQIIVGDDKGGIKNVGMTGDEGVDRYEKRRRRKLMQLPPRQVHSSAVTAIAVDPKSGTLLSGDDSGQLKITKSGTRTEAGSFSDGGQPPHLLTVVDKGRKLIGVNDSTLRAWDLGSAVPKKTSLTLPIQRPTALRRLPEQKGIAVGNDEGQIVIVRDDGTIASPVVKVCNDAIAALGYSAEEDSVLVATNFGEIIQVALPIDSIDEFELSQTPSFVVRSGPSSILAVGSSDKNLDVYDRKTGKPIRRYRLPTGKLIDGALSTDGTTAALVSDDGRVYFQADDGKTFASLVLGKTTQQINALGQDSHLLAFSQSDGNFGVAELPSSDFVALGKGAFTHAVATANGQQLVVASKNQAMVIAGKDGTPQHQARLPSGEVRSLMIDRDMAYIGSSDGNVFRWNYQQPSEPPRKLDQPGGSTAIVKMGMDRHRNLIALDEKGKQFSFVINRKAAGSKGAEAKAQGKSELASVKQSAFAAGLRWTAQPNQLQSFDHRGGRFSSIKTGIAKPAAVSGSARSGRIAILGQNGMLSIHLEPAAGEASVSPIQLPVNAKTDAPLALPANPMQWSADGRFLAVSIGNRLMMIDAETRSVQSVRILPAANLSVVAAFHDRCVLRSGKGRLVDIKVPTIRWRQRHTDTLLATLLRHDSRALAIGDASGAIAVYGLDAGQLIQKTKVPTSSCVSMTTIPNSNALATLSDDGAIHVIDGDLKLVKLGDCEGTGRVIAASRSGEELLVVNDAGQVFAWKLDQPDLGGLLVRQAVGDEQATASQIVPSENNRMVVFADGAKTVRSISTRGHQRSLVPRDSNGVIRDAAITGDGNQAIIIDGIGRVTRYRLNENGASDALIPGAKAHQLASSSRGDRFVVIADSIPDPSKGSPESVDSDDATSPHRLMLLDGRSEQSIWERPLGHASPDPQFSPDDSVITFQADDQSLTVVDASSGNVRQQLEIDSELASLVALPSMSKIWACNNQGQFQAIHMSKLSELDLQDSAVTHLAFLKRGDGFVIADANGIVNVRSSTEPGRILQKFETPNLPIDSIGMSNDGVWIAIAIADSENTVLLFKIDTANRMADQNEDGKTEPLHSIANEQPIRSIAFTLDSTRLLLGREDGFVTTHDVASGESLASFRSGRNPVVALSPGDTSDSFFAAGLDQRFRRWEFPTGFISSISSKPQTEPSWIFSVPGSPRPAVEEDSDVDDPLDAARLALIAGASTEEVLNLMDIDQQTKNDVQSSIAKLVSMEGHQSANPRDLSKQRRKLTKSQEKLAPLDQARKLSTYADGFSNLIFVGETNFKFDLDRTFRPVRLLMSDRFLYAARPGEARNTIKKKLFDEDGKFIGFQDFGDNGSLLSWDYKYSRLQAHAWSIEAMKVDGLVSLPNSADVVTVPHMRLFNQDGSSRMLGESASWATSNEPLPAKQYLAVGSAGSLREENNILSIFDVAELSDEQVAPQSQYRSYEGIVTAMTFANNAPVVAFSVRERAVHRLFIADAETLELTELEQVNHSKPLLERRDETQPVREISTSARGITALAFSPDDRILVVHSEHDRNEFQLSQWDLKWDNDRLLNFQKSRKHRTQQTAFFDTNSNHPVRFISRLLREDEKDPNDPNADFRRKLDGPAKLVAQRQRGFEVMRLDVDFVERKIPYPKTQQGKPEFDISDNGRWLLMGDDNGNATITDLVDGSQYSVTISEDLEKRVQQPSATRPEITEVPAHTGPVIGVAFSKPDPGQDYPAFAATFGEENKVKVWELYPILDPSTGLRSRRWVNQIKREVKAKEPKPKPRTRRRSR